MTAFCIIIGIKIQLECYFGKYEASWFLDTEFALLQSVDMDPTVSQQRFRTEAHRGNPENMAQAGPPSFWKPLIGTGETLNRYTFQYKNPILHI